jgi:hypothetical protein
MVDYFGAPGEAPPASAAPAANADMNMDDEVLVSSLATESHAACRLTLHSEQYSGSCGS